ncbi:divergent PAP2 family protein [Candidatus Woesearchaeota archaeon]|nr:divergent PAP2 family protein [Candidatus Woesearchaeota archaeon]
MELTTTIFELVTNIYIINCFFAVLVVQLIKTITASIEQGKLHLVSFFETGGMPSSHSALVTALTFSLFLYQGITPLFVVSLVFSAIIIRDSFGVRKSVGDHSMTLNQIILMINKQWKERKNTRQMKTKLDVVSVIKGHTLLQVIIGISFGIIIPLLIHYIFISL